MKRLPRGLGLIFAVLVIPTTAYAVNLSSNDGNGNQHVIDHGDQSFASTGWLRSTTGEPVYFRGIVVYNHYTDYTCNRLSGANNGNVTQRTYQARGGTCAQLLSIPPSADAAAWKICHYRRILPDGCGSQIKENF